MHSFSQVNHELNEFNLEKWITMNLSKSSRLLYLKYTKISNMFLIVHDNELQGS